MEGVKCSSMADHPLHDWYNKGCGMFCLWDGAYKRPLAANWKE